MKIDINEYVKNIDKTVRTEINSIPQEILDSLLERAYKDAEALFVNSDNTEFKQLTYAIYRSYTLGMLYGKTLKTTKSNRKFIRKDKNIIQLKVK